jgi:threonine dehydrogenase-like Zn-dependent dehydrogenase
VIAIDIDPARLELARSFGAIATVDATQGDVPQAVRELTAGRGAQVAIETSGSTPAAGAALRAVDVWGKVCFVGLGATVGFEVRAFLDRQITLMTSYSMSSVGQMECAEFVVQRQIDLDRLFTHRWPLDQAEQAYALFDLQSSGKGAIVF